MTSTQEEARKYIVEKDLQGISENMMRVSIYIYIKYILVTNNKYTIQQTISFVYTYNKYQITS